MTERLVKGASFFAEKKTNEQAALSRRLLVNHPRLLVQQADSRFSRSQKDIQRAMKQIIIKKQHEYDRIIGQLEALSPLKIMKRGYSIVYQEDKKLVKSVDQIRPNETVRIQLTDGSLITKVQEIKKGE